MLSVSSRLTFTAAVAAFAMTSCDVDLFGTDAKRITSGYYLSLTDGPDHCAIKTDRGFITPVLELVGWRKPLILCETEDKQWVVIATDTGQQTMITKAERENNPLYSTIEVQPAPEVWQSLRRRRKAW